MLDSNPEPWREILQVILLRSGVLVERAGRLEFARQTLRE